MIIRPLTYLQPPTPSLMYSSHIFPTQHYLIVTWHDYLSRIQNPFDALTWNHYELYRNELLDIYSLERLFIINYS